MSKLLRFTFLAHMIVAGVVGALLLVIPGRALDWIDWGPVEPILDRVLGAALLALGWSSFRGLLATERRQVALLIETEAIFCLLGCVGVGRHLLFTQAAYPIMVWVVFGVLAVFLLLWVVNLFTR